MEPGRTAEPVTQGMMNRQKISRATLAALIVWALGVIAFVCSFFVPLMKDPYIQANWVLALALIPATALGTGYYYGKGFRTNGLVLGACMFGVTILLDALVTVPLFLIPEGGNHAQFFADPVFWLLGLEYIGLVALYAHTRRQLKQKVV